MSNPINIQINVPTRDLDLAKKGIQDLRKDGTKSTAELNKGFKTVGETIKENSTTVKSFGSTASKALSGLTKTTKVTDAVNKGFNKTLKANPLFTLSGIIITVVESLADLVKGAEPVELVFKLIGDAIDFVIGLLKQFLDFLGLTSFAEKEAAAAAQKAAEERKAVNDILYSSMLRDMEREIALLQAQGASIEEIEEKQLELARVRAATAAQALADNQNIIESEIRLAEARGESVVELVQSLEELKNSAKDTQNALDVLELTVQNARASRREAEIKEQARTRAQLAAARKAEQEKVLAEERAFAQERLRVQRQIQDLSISSIVNTTERELEQNRIKYERLIQDTLANEKLLQEEREALISAFEQERDAAQAKINQKVLDQRKKAEEEFLAFLVKQSEDEDLIKQAAVEKGFEQELVKLQGFLEEGLITRERFLQLELELEAKKTRDLEKITTESLERRKQAEREAQGFIFELTASTEEKLINAIDVEFTAREERLRELREKGLISQAEFDDAILAAAQQRADALFNIERDRVNRELAENLRATEEKIAIAQGLNSALASLATASFEVSENLGKQDERSRISRAKKQFALTKALNIVQAGIDGAVGVTKAIAQFGPPPSPLGIAGITSAGIITAAQIAAIASQRFVPPTGESSGSTATPSLPNANVIPGSVTPRADFTPTGLGADIQPGESRTPQPQVIRAVVSETDLETNRRRLSTIRQIGEL